MKRVVCAVFDTATQLFGQPIFVPHRGQALRSFGDEVNNKQSAIGAHPDDYVLHELATFDDETGEFSTSRELIARGKDLVRS